MVARGRGGAAASKGRLRRVSVDDLTLRRVRIGRNFGYRDAEGGKITEEETLARIRALAIPPIPAPISRQSAATRRGASSIATTRIGTGCASAASSSASPG